jgi:hypothetical protein
MIHLVFPLALAFSLTRLVATEGGIQGRQLLPALGSLAILWVAGWWTLLPGRVRPVGLGLWLALLLGLAIWLPYRVVAQAFGPPPLLQEAELSPELPRLDWTYNDEMRLIGAEIGSALVRPGERVPVTLYWQALKPMQTNYSVFVHLIGRNYGIAGQFNTYPGLGLHPTRHLQPGQIVVDRYPVQVDGGSRRPAGCKWRWVYSTLTRPAGPACRPWGQGARRSGRSSASSNWYLGSGLRRLRCRPWRSLATRSG